MEKLANSPQCEPYFLNAYAKMLLDQQKRSDASLLLDRLEKVVKPGAAVPLRRTDVAQRGLGRDPQVSRRVSRQTRRRA